MVDDKSLGRLFQVMCSLYMSFETC